MSWDQAVQKVKGRTATTFKKQNIWYYPISPSLDSLQTNRCTQTLLHVYYSQFV